MQTLKRRDFLSSLAGGAVAAHSLTNLARGGSGSTSDQVGVALVGFNSMGMAHLRHLVNNPGCRVVSLCDIDEEVLERGKTEVRSATGRSVNLVSDYRKTLDDPAIDALIIATPHHWHTPIALAAMQAGKDVYVEKPASHVFREGRLLVDAAARHQRVFQHGTQMRSSPLIEMAMEVFRSGILGEIKIAKAYNCQDRGIAKAVSDGKPPQGVNYDRWLGPAPMRPFNAKRFHRTWRLFRDYGNGDFGDDGAHDLDLARWALGVSSHPLRVTAHGSNVREPGFREFPDNMVVSFDYPDGRTLIYEDRVFAPYGQNGVDSSNVFYGTEGYMVFSRRGFFRTYLGKAEEPGPSSGKSGRVGTPIPLHHDDFFHAVRTRGATTAPVEVAHLSCGLLHLGEIAYRTKSVVEFDPIAERITNNSSANDLLTKEYRSPYKLPSTA